MPEFPAVRWRRYAIPIVVLVLCSAPSPVEGQEIPREELSFISLDSLLNVPVHAAARHAQTMAEAPASVTIVTADDIARFGYRTLGDVLQRVRGFHLSSDRNYTGVGVRGLGRPGDYSNRVIVMLDGHPLNDNIYGAAYAGDDLGIPLREVERIEIVRGPGSALFGSGAMAAVIDIVTRSGVDGPPGSIRGASAAFEVGGAGYRQVEIGASGRAPGGLDVRLAARAGESDGTDVYFQDFDTPATNHGIAEGLDWERHAGALITARGEHLMLRARGSTRSKGIPTGAFDIDFNDPTARTVDAFVSLEAGYRRRVGPSLTADGRVSFDRFQYRGRYPYEGVAFLDSSVGHRVGGEAHAIWDLSPRHRVVVGGDVEINTRADYQAHDADEVEFDDNFPYHLVSAFIQDELYLSSSLTLTTGVRHDRYSYGRSMTVPRAALVYRANPVTTFKAIYGESFRAPNIYEREVELPGESLANRSLAGEHLRSVEMVVEHRIAAPVFATFTVYHNAIHDLIDTSWDTDGLLQFVNAGRATARGAELEVDVRSAGGVTGYASWVVQDVRDGSGEWLTNSPRQMAKAGASFPLGNSSWVAPEFRWEGERRTIAGGRTDPAALLRLAVTADPLPRLRLSVVADNLLDHTFSTPGAFEHRMDAIPQEGRRVRFGLAYLFQ